MPGFCRLGHVCEMCLYHKKCCTTMLYSMGVVICNFYGKCLKFYLRGKNFHENLFYDDKQGSFRILS